MRRSFSGRSSADAIFSTLDKSLAIIRFDPAGKILSANANFCKVLGYEEREIVGQHHSLFVDPDYVRTEDYREFWRKLGRGMFDSAEYKRLAKGGRPVWIRATYNPVVDRRGRVTEVVKLASDVTVERLQAAESSAVIAAISKTQAVIEFTRDGTVLTANALFERAMGTRSTKFAVDTIGCS